jgi:hypothetical protein
VQEERKAEQRSMKGMGSRERKEVTIYGRKGRMEGKQFRIQEMEGRKWKESYEEWKDGRQRG